MTPNRTAPRTAGVLALAVVAGLALALAPLLSSTAHADGRNGPITRAHVIERAAVWMKRNVQYSQSGTAKAAFGTTRYRRDCSGFVSMAWHLAPVGLSAPNTNRLATSTYTHKIKKSNLKKGDILDWPGHHVVLFQKWANSAHTKIRLYEESNPSHDMNHRTESLSYYHAFTARRYNKIK